MAAKELQEKLGPDSRTRIGYLTLDVTNTASIREAVRALQDPNGPLGDHAGCLDVLINNAGVGYPPARQRSEEMFLRTEFTTAEDILGVMATNVAAVVEFTSKRYFISTLGPN